MATNWVDEVLSGATSTGSKTISLATDNVLSVANTSSENLFTVTSDTTNGGFTSILGIEAQEAVLFLAADNGDEEADVWEIQADTAGNFKLGLRSNGTGSPTRGNTIVSKFIVDTNSEISLSNNDAGISNTIFGKDAGDAIASGGNYNSIFGEDAGTALTTGDNNVVMGYQAGSSITDDDGITAVGTYALSAATIGGDSGSVAVGYWALKNNTTGIKNTAVGYQALQTNVDAHYNTAIGYKALYTAEHDGVDANMHNTALGHLAGTATICRHIH